MTFEVTVTIPHDHPSFPGHFPTHPVVPGVVLLGEVFKALRKRDGPTVGVLGSPSLKFLSPLRPGETVSIRLEPSRVGEVLFTCSTPERLIASGCLEYRPEPVDLGGNP